MKKISVKKKLYYILVLVLLSIIISSCVAPTSTELSEKTNSSTPSYKGTIFEKYIFPEGFNIHQYEGVKLDFIVENNINGSVLLQESQAFTKMTGIEVNIRPIDYDTLMQKINLDFIGNTGNYELLYVDPYQTLSKFSEYLEPLNSYIEGERETFLQMPIEDFYEDQVSVVSQFETSELYYALPFDTTTMIMFYRKDIFEEYKDDFYRAYGYDWTPTNENFTWEKYIEVSKWITKYVPKSKVRSGSAQMAEQHNSIFCEFLNVLGTYGEIKWSKTLSDSESPLLGVVSLEGLRLNKKAMIQALTTYKNLIDVSHEESIHWNWSETAKAFSEGEIAMMLNWDENYYRINKNLNFREFGEVGIAPIPKGKENRKSLFGGAGIGINKQATQEEKDAAWFFITWATSPEMQKRILTQTEGMFMPTLKSLNQSPELFDSIYYETMGSIFKLRELLYRPKSQDLYQFEEVITHNLHQMFELEWSAKETYDHIMNQWNKYLEQ